IHALAVGSDTLATAGADRTVKVWDGGTGVGRHSLSVPDEPLCVALAHDDRWLAVGLRNGVVKLYDAATGNERLSFQAHTKPVLAVALSADGGQLASGSEEGPVKYWDLASGGVRDVTLPQGGRVRGLVFSSDGRLLAATVEGLRGAFICETASGKF